MIHWIVNKIFAWKPLREAIFDEVHMYDHITKVMADPTPGSHFWAESDGWRGWTYDSEQKRYTFIDVPQDGMIDIMSELLDSKQ